MLYDKMHYVCTLIGFGCYHQQHFSLLEERCTDEVTINNTLVFEGKTNWYHITVGLFSYRLNKKASRCGKNIGDTLSWMSCTTFFFFSCKNLQLIDDWPENGDVVNHLYMNKCNLGWYHNKSTAVFMKIITAAVFEPPCKEFHHLFN